MSWRTIDFATVTPSLVICAIRPAPGQMSAFPKGSRVKRGKHLGTAKGLLDDDIASLWSEGDGDGLCEDVDAGEERLPSLVTEAEVLRALCGVSCGSAESLWGSGRTCLVSEPASCDLSVDTGDGAACD